MVTTWWDRWKYNYVKKLANPIFEGWSLHIWEKLTSKLLVPVQYSDIMPLWRPLLLHYIYWLYKPLYYILPRFMGDEGGGNRTPATCLSQDHAISDQSPGQNHLDNLDHLVKITWIRKWISISIRRIYGVGEVGKKFYLWQIQASLGYFQFNLNIPAFGEGTNLNSWTDQR